MSANDSSTDPLTGIVCLMHWWFYRVGFFTYLRLAIG